jgi:hypothetical protein
MARARLQRPGIDPVVGQRAPNMKSDGPNGRESPGLCSRLTELWACNFESCRSGTAKPTLRQTFQTTTELGHDFALSGKSHEVVGRVHC